jgi:hypothetical protein
MSMSIDELGGSGRCRGHTGLNPVAV